MKPEWFSYASSIILIHNHPSGNRNPSGADIQLTKKLKEAGIDGEMREIFFGHRRSRTEYGSGGALAWRRSLLERMVLPYDPDILT